MPATDSRNDDGAIISVCSALVVAIEEDEGTVADTRVGFAASGRPSLAEKYVDDVVCWSTHAANGEPLPPPLP